MSFDLDYMVGTQRWAGENRVITVIMTHRVLHDCIYWAYIIHNPLALVFVIYTIIINS